MEQEQPETRGIPGLCCLWVLGKRMKREVLGQSTFRLEVEEGGSPEMISMTVAWCLLVRSRSRSRHLEVSESCLLASAR